MAFYNQTPNPYTRRVVPFPTPVVTPEQQKELSLGHELRRQMREEIGEQIISVETRAMLQQKYGLFSVHLEEDDQQLLQPIRKGGVHVRRAA